MDGWFKDACLECVVGFLLFTSLLNMSELPRDVVWCRQAVSDSWKSLHENDTTVSCYGKGRGFQQPLGHAHMYQFSPMASLLLFHLGLWKDPLMAKERNYCTAVFQACVSLPVVERSTFPCKTSGKGFLNTMLLVANTGKSHFSCIPFLPWLVC